MNFDLFTEAAVNLVNEGYWDPDFPGMYDAINQGVMMVNQVFLFHMTWLFRVSWFM